MDFEPSEHEPDEWDPEAEYRDQESDSLTIPEVTTADTDAPPDVVQTFWIVVAVVNVAVLFLALGAMFVAFQVDVELGGALLAGGLVLFALAYRRYRAFSDEDDGDEDDGDDHGAMDGSGTVENGSTGFETNSRSDSQPSSRARSKGHEDRT